MKIVFPFFLALFFLIIGIDTIYAQDVYINIPASSIFNRSEFTTVQNVMNTNRNNSWKFGGVDPRIRSISGDFFTHATIANTSLPSTFLQWQLANIGGKIPTFNLGDVLPGYQWFSSSYQAWYKPGLFSSFNAGNIAFRFRIPANEIETNVYYAGLYKMQISQDYGSSFLYSGFTPENFNIYISVPEEIKWLSVSDSKYVIVNSLNQFKGSQFVINIDPMEIGHTVDFNLLAQSDKKEVQFKSLNGKDRKFDISVVRLGSNNPKINTLTLDKTWKNQTSGGGFKVQRGNRANLELQLSILNEDFKNYFFEAGTYTFQVNLDAKATTGSTHSEKQIDITLVVPVLSEITVPSGNSEVNFTFNTMQHYNEGQSQSVPNQIRVSNNENYELYVKSSANYFNSNGIQSDINASILEIGVQDNEKITLSTKSQKLMRNGTPVIDKNINIIYTISPTAAQSLIIKEKKTYGINVIYSFTAL